MRQRSDELIIREKHLSVSGRWLKTARLADEWHEDIDDPAALIADLMESGLKADLFTFWQRMPYTEPRFRYQTEWESIAVLPVTTYGNWLKTQINCKTRNLIVKARKKGVVVKSATFDDDFVRGMTAIFNETPIRQGRPFRHYGKSVETVRSEFSRYLFREELIGAYLDDDLIGFIMLADAGRFAMLGQIISMVRHRDKSPNNALIAKAVEVCAERKIPSLVYAMWARGSLGEFKRHNGFMRIDLPRYYVPLTRKGRFALAIGLHRHPIDRIPETLVPFLRDLRTRFYALRYRTARPAHWSP
jgi:hypothetical protein